MKISVLSLLVLLVPLEVAACTFYEEDRSVFQMRWQSKPVTMGSQCQLSNGGVFDNLTLGPATDLGNGRVQQVVGTHSLTKVLLGDCNTKEATILLGAVTATVETSCGFLPSFADLVGENAMMSLSVGNDLHELVALAAQQGVKELNPIEEFFTFERDMFDDEVHEVGAKDRFDLLCGCKIHYPNSSGASQ